MTIWQTRCWQIYPQQMAISQSSYLADQVLADLPLLEWQFYRFLLLELIFDSYLTAHMWQISVGRSTPYDGNFTDSYSESSYLADQVLADLPPEWSFCRFLLLELIFFHTLTAHMWQTKCRQIYPLTSNGNYRFLL